MDGKKALNIPLGPVSFQLGPEGLRSWFGFALAAAAGVSCCAFSSPIMGLIFAVLFCTAGITRIDGRGIGAKRAIHMVWLAATLLALSYIAPAIVGRALPVGQLGLNMLCCGLVVTLLLLVTGSWQWAAGLGAFGLLALAVANGYVYIFREREFSVLDIFTATTALKVAQQYNYTPTPAMLHSTIWGIFLIYALFCLPKVRVERPLRLRLLALAGLAAGCCALFWGSRSLEPYRWDTEGSSKNGTYLNIFLGLRDCGVRTPAGYDPEMVEQTAQSHSRAQGSTGPNILVIMNESYCDLDLYANPPETDVPATPYWDSLEENAIKGYALSSVYGGNTVNSEFEFLTGSSMAFLPTGAVPYIQYVRENTYSLAWALQRYGYTTLATHNYYASGWERERVYPLLGFQESTFLEAYPQKDTPRGFVSDREQYEYLVRLLSQQEKPAFLFAVTMQNHGGYTNPQDSYDHTVTLTGQARDESAEQYLSMLNASDKALEYLLTTLEKSSEDTLVLIFGDHQPKLQRSFYESLNGSPLDTLPEQQLQYTVPFLIWANYDIAEKQLPLTSLNYLAGHLLDAAGLQRPEYWQYLAQLEHAVPAMNLLGYYSQSAGGFLPYSQSAGREADTLLAYSQAQYNALFDRRSTSKTFFTQYLPG